MKKELKIIIVISILLVSASIYFGILSKHKYENLIIDDTKWIDIINKREYKDSLLISDLKFNNYELFYDIDTSTYYYSIMKDYKYAYKPYIKYKSIDSIAFIGFDKEITPDLIKNNETIRMIIYNNSYYNIIKIKCTTLSLMNIDTKGVVDSEKYTLSSIKFLDNTKGEVESLKANIKYRGAASLSFPKKGYRISLRDGLDKINYSFLGLRKDDDWVLYAAYNDQEKIRNVFSSKLWNECCSNYTNGTEYKYIELFINGKYQGLYALGYPIDEKSVDVSFDDYMYKKKTWESNDKDIPHAKSVDSTGLELINDSDPTKAFEAIKTYYKVLLGNDTLKMHDYINTLNAVDIYMFYNLVQGIDNVNEYKTKNTYITIKDGKIIYTPWDLDYTFGNSYQLNSPTLTKPYGLNYDFNVIMKANLAYRIKRMGDNSLDEIMSKRYSDLRKTYWSDSNVIKLIDEYEEDIFSSGAFLRDKEKWPEGNYINVNLKLSRFKSYVIERLSYMDKYMNKYVGYEIK